MFKINSKKKNALTFIYWSKSEGEGCSLFRECSVHSLTHTHAQREAHLLEATLEQPQSDQLAMDQLLPVRFYNEADVTLSLNLSYSVAVGLTSLCAGSL